MSSCAVTLGLLVLAEWLFAVPGSAVYTIPETFYENEFGALWGAALLRSQGDALVTIGEAAQLAGVSVQAISQRIDQGTLRAYIDPLANSRQGRRLVRRSDVAP